MSFWRDTTCPAEERNQKPKPEKKRGKQRINSNKATKKEQNTVEGNVNGGTKMGVTGDKARARGETITMSHQAGVSLALGP